MKIDVVSWHVPDPAGTAAGRILYATVLGHIDHGDDVRVWSWRPTPPEHEPPAWCEWRPLPPEPWLRNRMWSLARPRDETARAGWLRRPGAIAVADDPLSFGAVRHEPASVVTVHLLNRLDCDALGRTRRSDRQMQRLDRRVAGHTGRVWGYSPEVVAGLGRGRFVPAAHPMPDQPAGGVEQPVSAMVADWRWEPNRQALAQLMAVWPEVVRRVPGARLLVAGRGSSGLGPSAPRGVEDLGEVASSEEVLRQASLLAFPCPGTSGPKVKTFEALSLGLPVVTTRAGVEGLLPRTRQGAVVCGRREFAAELAALLGDPVRRAELGAAGRRGFAAEHAPSVVARVRRRLLDDDPDQP